MQSAVCIVCRYTRFRTAVFYTDHCTVCIHFTARFHDYTSTNDSTLDTYSTDITSATPTRNREPGPGRTVRGTVKFDALVNANALGRANRTLPGGLWILNRIMNGVNRYVNRAKTTVTLSHARGETTPAPPAHTHNSQLCGTHQA